MTDLQGKFDDETITISGYTFRKLLKRSADFGITNYMALQTDCTTEWDYHNAFFFSGTLGNFQIFDNKMIFSWKISYYNWIWKYYPRDAQGPGLLFFTAVSFFGVKILKNPHKRAKYFVWFLWLLVFHILPI